MLFEYSNTSVVEYSNPIFSTNLSPRPRRKLHAVSASDRTQRGFQIYDQAKIGRRHPARGGSQDRWLFVGITS